MQEDVILSSKEDMFGKLLYAKTTIRRDRCRGLFISIQWMVYCSEEEERELIQQIVTMIQDKYYQESVALVCGTNSPIAHAFPNRHKERLYGLWGPKTIIHL